MSPISYKDAGVDYAPIDRFKRFAQAQASSTAGNIAHLGIAEVPESRGESVYLLELPDRYLAFVDEGLGTKHLVTQALEYHYGTEFWGFLGFDTVAMAVNDLITLGAQPLTASMHLQVQSADWFEDESRWRHLAQGWKRACDAAGCTWGPGETPALNGVIVPGTCSLSSAAMGTIYPKSRRMKGDVQDGDRIILLASSGIHANGLSLARKAVEKLPRGYLTRAPNGAEYGTALVQPTVIYAAFVDECIRHGIRIRYMVNITGHGWRKLMRLDAPFAYAVHAVPVPPEFTLIQGAAELSDKQMYETFNMGAGFALYVHPDDAYLVRELDGVEGVAVFDAGEICASDQKQVVIRRSGKEPIVFGADELEIR